jgi:hypothetical protein
VRRVEFITSAFRGTASVHESQAYLQILLHSLVVLDLAYLRFHPETPELYRSGIRYHREPQGYEQWLTAPCVVAQRWGDC